MDVIETGLAVMGLMALAVQYLSRVWLEGHRVEKKVLERVRRYAGS